jgi:hypothetical protein
MAPRSSFILKRRPRSLGPRPSTLTDRGTRRMRCWTAEGPTTCSHRPTSRKTVRAAVYDAETAAFIGDSPDVEINSHQNAQKNADGSADVFFRPRAPAETGQGFLLFLRSECWSGGKICFPQLRVALVSAGCVIVFLSGCATPYATIGGSLEIQLALDSYRIGDACEGLCRLMVSRPMERCSNRESAHSATMASCRRS